MLVVRGHPGPEKAQVRIVRGRDQREAGHEEQVHPPKVLAALDGAPRAACEPVRRFVHRISWRGVFAEVTARERSLRHARGIETPMQEAHVRLVDLALERLGVVAVLLPAGGVALCRGQPQPLELGQLGALFRPGRGRPTAAAALEHRVGVARAPCGGSSSPPARRACPGNGPRHRISSRGRRSAGHPPRSCRSRGWRAGADSARPSRPARPALSRNATRHSPSSVTRLGGASTASSSDRRKGSQWRRNSAPIGVPGPTRVRRSLSSRADPYFTALHDVGAGRVLDGAGGNARRNLVAAVLLLPSSAASRPTTSPHAASRPAATRRQSAERRRWSSSSTCSPPAG